MATPIEIGSKSEPFTVDDVRSMHGMLMSTSNVREDQHRAGEVRAQPVFIGGSMPATAEYVGTPSERIDVAWWHFDGVG